MKSVGVTLRKAAVTGAQTDRPNDAGPARDFLGGKDSPAVFLLDSGRVGIAHLEFLVGNARREFMVGNAHLTDISRPANAPVYQCEKRASLAREKLAVMTVFMDGLFRVLARMIHRPAADFVRSRVTTAG